MTDEAHEVGGTTLSLRDLGLTGGQAKHVDMFVELPAYVQAGIDYESMGGGTNAGLDIMMMVEGTAYHLQFEHDYTGPCARCLEPATFHAVVDSYQVHDPRAEDDEDGELTSDHIDEDAQELDLTAWAREEVGLIFPTKVLCRPDCPGMETTYADPPSEDEVDADGNPIDPRWAALKKLQQAADSEG